MATKWNAKGVLIGACSCDWGCPCSFDAPPTQGKCEGGYVWQITEGRFGEVPLAGLSMSWLAHSPAALHKGNVTSLTLIDEKANPAQRAALTTLSEGKSGGPWVIFSAVTAHRLGPKFAPFHVETKTLDSRVRIGDLYEVELGPILNPVSSEPEEIYLDKPTGFTSKRLTLGRSKVMRLKTEFKLLNYDHSGLYGEFSHFDYAGESAS
jgi:hypothetical protein